MEFLDPGIRIKNLRKQLGLKQEDLQDENFSRAFLSMIECGKRYPSRKAAKIIVSKLKEKAEQLGIKLDIDEEYILASPVEQAKDYCIKKLDSITQSNVDEIIDISKKYDLNDILIKAYIIKANLAFQTNDYSVAFINYREAIDTCKNISKEDMQPFLFNKLGRCKEAQTDYIEAIYYFNKAKDYSRIQNDMKTIKNSIYNLAVCYKKLGKIDESLYYIEDYISLCNQQEEFVYYIYANILKANCYRTKMEVQKAIDLYIKLIDKCSINMFSLLSLIYVNIGLLYLDIDNFETSLEYFNKAEKIIEEKDITNLPKILIHKADLYIKSQLYSDAIVLLEQGIDMAKRYNNKEYILKGYFMLADIYYRLNDISKTEDIYIDILSLLQDKRQDKEIMGIYADMSLMYIKNDNVEECKKYLSELHKIIKKVINNY